MLTLKVTTTSFHRRSAGQLTITIEAADVKRTTTKAMSVILLHLQINAESISD